MNMAYYKKTKTLNQIIKETKKLIFIREVNSGNSTPTRAKKEETTMFQAKVNTRSLDYELVKPFIKNNKGMGYDIFCSYVDYVSNDNDGITDERFSKMTGLEMNKPFEDLFLFGSGYNNNFYWFTYNTINSALYDVFHDMYKLVNPSKKEFLIEDDYDNYFKTDNERLSKIKI